MQITKEQLKTIIKEELQGVLSEDWDAQASAEQVFGAESADKISHNVSVMGSALIDELLPFYQRNEGREELISFIELESELLGGVPADEAVDWFLHTIAPQQRTVE